MQSSYKISANTYSIQSLTKQNQIPVAAQQPKATTNTTRLIISKARLPFQELKSQTLLLHLCSSGKMLVKDLARFKMEVEKRLHDQLEVQRQLQLRIEAQGKYLQKIIEEQKVGDAISGSNGVASADDDKKEQASTQSELPPDAPPPAESSSS